MEPSRKNELSCSYSVNRHTPSESTSSTPSLLGLPIEVRFMILKYLLVAPQPLKHEPPALKNGVVTLLEDWDPGNDDEDSDRGNDEDTEDDMDDDDDRYTGVDGYADWLIEREEKASEGGVYKLPAKVEPQQTRICRWLIGNEECAKKVETNRCHPAVLRTCRQIYNEGQNLLYLNTITITYFCADFNDKSTNRAYVLGQESVRSLFEAYPLSKNLKRWSIKIWCDSDEETDIDSGAWSATVARDIEMLRDVGTLDDLELRVHLLSPSNSERGQGSVDNSCVFYNPIRSLRSQNCTVSLDRSGDHEDEYYQKKEQDIQEEIMSGSIPRDPYLLIDRIHETVNEILKSSDGLLWYRGNFIGSTNDWLVCWKLPSFGDISSLEYALDDLFWSIYRADHEVFFEDARIVISQITDYVETASQVLDRQVARASPVTWTLHPYDRPRQNLITERFQREQRLIREQRQFLQGIGEEMRSYISEYRLESKGKVEE